MSGFFYITTADDEVYELTLVSDINISYNSRSSSYPVESGDRISDNVVNDKVKIEYKGLISNIQNYMLLNTDGYRSVQEIYEKLVNLRNTRTPFSVNYDNRQTNDSLLPAIDNCVFDRLEFSRNSDSPDHYFVNIAVSQILLSERAIQITQPVMDENTANQSSGVRDGSSNSTKNVKQEKRDLLSKIYDGAIDFFAGGQDDRD